MLAVAAAPCAAPFHLPVKEPEEYHDHGHSHASGDYFGARPLHGTGPEFLLVMLLPFLPKDPLEFLLRLVVLVNPVGGEVKARPDQTREQQYEQKDSHRRRNMVCLCMPVGNPFSHIADFGKAQSRRLDT